MQFIKMEIGQVHILKHLTFKILHYNPIHKEPSKMSNHVESFVDRPSRIHNNKDKKRYQNDSDKFERRAAKASSIRRKSHQFNDGISF
jgi:hypothetical protein